MFSMNLMLPFIDKVTTATYNLALVIWNVAPAASDAAAAWTGGLAFGSAATAAVLDIWDIIQSSDPDKSSYISQLIKGKSRALRKLFKYEQQLLCLIYYY